MTDITKIRRQNLQGMIDACGLSVIAAKLGKPPRQILDMAKGRKSFGERIARELEKNHSPDRPPGWLDAESPILPQQGNTTLVQDISEAVLLLGQLTDEQRAGFMHQLRAGALPYKQTHDNAAHHTVHESKADTLAWNTHDNSAEHLGTQPVFTGSENSAIAAKKKAADCAQRPLSKLQSL